MKQRTPDWSEASLEAVESLNNRIRLQLAERLGDLAQFNLAIDGKLRGCDLVGRKVNDVAQGGSIFRTTIVIQQKTHGLFSSKLQSRLVKRLESGLPTVSSHRATTFSKQSDELRELLLARRELSRFR